MNIYKGKVLGPGSIKTYKRPADGQFYVQIKMSEGLTEDVVATYTTPFYSIGYGGVLALPDPGSVVLVFRDTDNKYYYLSTVVEKADPNSVQQPRDMFPNKKQVYPDESTLGRRVTFENQFGAGLKMNHLYTSSNIIDNVAVKSTKGKMLLLSDSLKNDSIALFNEHDDGITISSGGNSSNETRSINITAQNSISCVSHQGKAQLVVGNGGHIDIINYSSDLFNTNVLNPAVDGGDVNIISQNRDINISVRGVTSNIFITTKLVRVRIDETGTVSVQAPIINLKGSVAINMDAPVINMNSDAGTFMYSNGITNITSNATTEIEGSAGVYLNSGFAGSPSPITPDPTLTDNLD